MDYRTDKTLVLNDVLHALRAIRELLEWQKKDTLEQRAQGRGGTEWDEETVGRVQDQMIEKQRVLVAETLAKNKAAQEEHEKKMNEIQRQWYERHIAQYHGGVQPAADRKGAAN